MIILANGKRAKTLEQERTFFNACTMHLFISNTTPTPSTVVGAFTECTDGGYAPVTPIGFTAAILNGSNLGEMSAPAISWVFDYTAGPQTVYGYYLTDNADGLLVYSERFATPFPITAAGQVLGVVPRYQHDEMP